MTDDATQREITALRRLSERQTEAMAEMQRNLARAMEWMTSLTFEDHGVLKEGETPPILRLLASIQNDNITIREQNARIIEQNALLIGEPTNEEAAAFQDMKAKGGVSLPALLKLLGDVRYWVRVAVVGLVFVLGLLALHHWYLVDRFSNALGWILALLR